MRLLYILSGIFIFLWFHVDLSIVNQINLLGHLQQMEFRNKLTPYRIFCSSFKTTFNFNPFDLSHLYHHYEQILY